MNIQTVTEKLNINSKAIGLIAEMEAILTTPELIDEYIVRVQSNLNTISNATNKVLHEMRLEILDQNNISLEEFYNSYSVDPAKALTTYFKESIVMEQIKRLKLLGVDILDVINIAKNNNGMRFDRAVMMLI
ncbi:hypothetical protein [Paenibacillus silvae]|uniref:Uncharacterized protein n=1 Tax=Paenibacillus silvae TaxID=1325358 RepID=A0A2W6NNN8_9BACL|nr:hypothetical protein [Paenibacillus silvae]PZT57454.1 hypothetical protein DN757_02015 [Paenibacillus silvae]